MEEITGRWARSEDLGVCQKALQQLHDLEIGHGHVNKYNICTSKRGGVFIDFEDCTIVPVDKDDEMTEEKE